MRKGENIFKRKDGRWEARYIKGYELSAKSNTAFATAKPTRKQKKRWQNTSLHCSPERLLRRPAHDIALAFTATSGFGCAKTKYGNLPTLNMTPLLKSISSRSWVDVIHRALQAALRRSSRRSL